LITGANRGLGFETARALGQSGVTTIVGSRDAAKGKQATDELRGEGLEAGSVTLDVTSVSSVQAAAKRVERQYGRLDILVNNAAVLPEATAAEIARPLDLSMFRETFETNVFGAVTVTQAFLPLLRRAASGRVDARVAGLAEVSGARPPNAPPTPMTIGKLPRERPPGPCAWHAQARSAS
jgi:NAD(P)-dependent dehydrogenase (short-subunit alcohol dehydrogenase family)